MATRKAAKRVTRKSSARPKKVSAPRRVIYDIKINHDRHLLTLGARNKSGMFPVINSSIASDGFKCLLFKLTPEVENLDNGSVYMECFKKSEKVKVGNVIFHSEWVKAKSIDDVKQAAQKVLFTAWDPEDRVV